MKKALNWRTASFAGWIVVTMVIMMLMPDMDRLVREKGQVGLTDTTQSEVAKSMISRMNEGGGENYDIIAVFNSGQSTPLSPAQKDEISAILHRLQEEKNELGIRELTTHLDSEQTAKQLVSEDGTTILAQIGIHKNAGTISEVSDKLEASIQPKTVKIYLTGTDLVLEDFMQSTQDGIKKTEIIAVVFILLVLVIVFRSPIVPLISLTTVGVSYLVSLGVIAQLVDHFDFPFSNFTQVFLVVILFGIGTDYNILLYTRFKEELSRDNHVLSAIKATYKSAGKTVLYSGLAVLIGFLTLFLAEFKLYRASSAVAIGVAVLLLALITLNPFFMALLGKKMFWPVKTFEGHGESRLWGFLSRHAVLRPILFLLVSAAIAVPFAIKYSGSLSYNDLLEVDDAFGSKQGINVIGDHFPPGFSSPVSIVIQSDRAMNNSGDLQAIDELADKVAKVKGISSTYTVTRPEGKRIDSLYINDQTGELRSGLEDAGQGIGKINEGLSSAEDKFNSGGSGTEPVEQLIAGTKTAREGAAALGEAIDQLSAGITSGVTGAAQVEGGLTSIQKNLKELNQATAGLYGGYTKLQSGLASFSGSFDKLSQAIEGAKTGYEQIEGAMTRFVQAHPDMAEDQNVQTTLDIATTGKKQLTGLSAQLEQLVPQYAVSMDAFRQANASLQQVDQALDQLQTGVSKLQSGASALQTGLKKAGNGSTTIAGKSRELADGIGKVQEGQQQLLNGLKDLQAQMNTLKSGLKESTDGLKQVNDGLNDAEAYLADLSQSDAARKFYIPQEVLAGEEFQRSIDMYMSADHKTVRMMVIMSVNPYSKEAMNIIEDLGRQLTPAVQGSSLSGVKIAIGGKSSQNNDLQEIAGGDFTRTAMLMLIGIGIMLILITRSFWYPVFIIASLLLSYGAAIGISELVAKWILGVDQLGWNVPFFGFIMIVALGVDYSIFLMARYRELKLNPSLAIVEASRHIGNVVISAAVILGGTFAALMPSGVLTLIEVAIVVIVALALLSFVMLPILIPSLISLMDKWSGKPSEE